VLQDERLDGRADQRDDECRNDDAVQKPSGSRGGRRRASTRCTRPACRASRARN
jgi:hypothetical protein